MAKINLKLFGLIFIINVIIIFLRFLIPNIDTFNGNLLSSIIFIIIFSILLYCFIMKKYDYFILIWLSFYFACPIIKIPFTTIGSLGLLNAIFLPLMVIKSFKVKNKFYIILSILFIISIHNIANVDLRIIISRIFLFLAPFIFFNFVMFKCKNYKLIIFGSIFIALINVPIGLYQILFQPVWGGQSDWRSYRIFGNLFWHNSYSFYLLPVILTLYSFLRKKFELKYLLFLLLLLFVDLFTFSRAGLLGLMVGLLMFEFYFKKSKNILFKRVIIVFTILLFFLFYSILSANLDRHLTPETISERTGIWVTVMPFIEGHFLLGNGLGSYELYRSQILGSLSTHNIYLSIIFEIGVIGLITMMYYLFLIFIKFRKKILKQNFSLSGSLGIALVFSILIYSLVGNAAFTPVVSLNTWIMLACFMRLKDEKN
jgi:O-antigen ligase